MIHESPFTGLALTMLAAAVYAAMGLFLLRRPVSADSRPAALAYATWWVALALNTLMGVARSLLVWAGVQNFGVYVAMTYLALGVLCVALWGLLYYLIYLFTGSDRAIYWITGFYVLYFLVLVATLSLSRPIAIDYQGLSANVVYVHPLEGPIVNVLLVLLVMPQILAAFALLALYPRASTSTQRYRIVLVSLSIIVWFGSALVSSFGGFGDRFTWWPLMSRLIALTATLFLVIAYFPPHAVQRRYGILSLRDERHLLPAEQQQDPEPAPEEDAARAHGPVKE